MLKGEKLVKELERLAKMSEYENKYFDSGLEYIAGVDEAGRGPLCGPVVAACVILPKYCVIHYLNDSKKLSEKRRDELFPIIKETAQAWSVSVVEPETIDEINILNATKLAMRNSVLSLSLSPQAVLVDAVTIPGTDIAQEAIIKGDEKSVSIAAASVIAKVTRDRIMAEMGRLYPGYGFERNKGYGTAEHIRAIKELGLTPIHRRSFCGNFIRHN